MRFGKTNSNKFDCFALNFHYICLYKQHGVLSLAVLAARGKSGQHRVPYFLTGSCRRRQSSVTENNRRFLEAVRVKRRGKSSPGVMATLRAAHLMGCKVKYTGI